MIFPSPTGEKWHPFSAPSPALTFKATRPLYCYGVNAEVRSTQGFPLVWSKSVTALLVLSGWDPGRTDGLSGGNWPMKPSDWGLSLPERAGGRWGKGKGQGVQGARTKAPNFLSPRALPDMRTLQTSTSRGPNLRPCPFPSPEIWRAQSGRSHRGWKLPRRDWSNWWLGQRDD